MNLVPCMHETVLCEVVGDRIITRQLAQEVSYLRLVASDQLAKSGRVLTRHDPCDKKLIVYDYDSLIPTTSLSIRTETIH